MPFHAGARAEFDQGGGGPGDKLLDLLPPPARARPASRRASKTDASHVNDDETDDDPMLLGEDDDEVNASANEKQPNRLWRRLLLVMAVITGAALPLPALPLAGMHGSALPVAVLLAGVPSVFLASLWWKARQAGGLRAALFPEYGERRQHANGCWFVERMPHFLPLVNQR